MRRTSVQVLTAAALVATLAVSPGREAAASPAVSANYNFCPASEPLLGWTTAWKHHLLAPGVWLAQTTVHDKRDRMRVSVVRVNLHKPNVVVAPLRRALASRHRLTALAAHRNLVAATNGMYFSFAYGAPVAPFVSGGRPLVLSTRPEPVAGIGVDHRAQDGNVWLVGHVRSQDGTLPLVAVNEVEPPPGFTLYTEAWGAHPVPLPPGSRSRELRAGRLLVGLGRQRFVPRHGQLLVANGASAVTWLTTLPRRGRITVSRRVETDAKVPFSQAYGVGTQIVAAAGQILDDLYCRRDEIYAARTAIAWSGNGSQLMLVTVEGRRGSEHYGLDENQMSELLVDLGASQAFALDGGGSTELVTRLPGHKKLSLQTVSPGRRERPIPVGVGVYSRPSR
jgi:Phosphodiester glycosidase